MFSTPLQLPLPPPRPSAPWIHLFVRAILKRVPQSWKIALYERCFVYHDAHRHKISSRLSSVCRLPFGIALKRTRTNLPVEADALRVIERRYPHIHAPLCIDWVANGEIGYMVSSWVDGDVAQDVWQDLSKDELTCLAHDIRSQLDSTRLVDDTHSHPICSASLGPITDTRLEVHMNLPSSFDSWTDFSRAIWAGLNSPSRTALRDELLPLIERRHVPVQFCHGDITPWNIVFPDGLKAWRRGENRAVLVDWERAAWMPVYWDALRMAYLVFDRDDPHWEFIHSMFPEYQDVVLGDYEWRSRSGFTLL